MICYKLHGNCNQWGIPDRFFGYQGGCLFIEFKRPVTGGKMSPFQKVQRRKLQQNGFTVMVMNDYEECIKILKAWKLSRDIILDGLGV